MTFVVGHVILLAFIAWNLYKRQRQKFIIFLPDSTYLCLPAYVYVQMSTYLCVPAYVYVQMSTYLWLPAYVYVQMSTYLCLPAKSMY